MTRSGLSPVSAPAPPNPQPLSSHELDRAAGILLFFGCLGYLFLFRRFTSLEPDEGIVLQGATRILHGQLPYRDFFSFYTPGSFYLVAALFRVFGNSFGVARISLAFAGAACSVVTFLLARRVCSRSVSFFIGVLATIVGASFRFLVLHNCYSTLFTCLALYASIRMIETSSTAWSFATGTFAGFTFLTEQSKGGGLVLGLLLGFLLIKTVKEWPRRFAFACAGFLWPVLLTFLYFWTQHAFGEMLSSWLWPLHHYTAANHVPYGWQNWSDSTRDVVLRTGPLPLRIAKIIAVSPAFIVPVLPILGIGILVYWIRSSRNAPPEQNAAYYLMTGSAMAGLLLSVVFVRADILHFMYLAPLWYIVLGWVLGAPAASRLLSRARPLLIAYFAAAFGMLGFAVLLASTGSHNWLQTRRGLVTTGAPDSVMPFIQTQVPPGDKLLVYPYLPLYNYFTDTISPSRYDFFQPGMNTPEQAQEIIKSLQETNTRSVLFEPWFPEKFANSWPETPVSAIAHDPVADYISKNFRICEMLESPEHWRFHYMVRKGLPCPAD